MSKPSLLTRLYGWWEFEQNFNAGHTAMDSSSRQNHIPTFGNDGWGARSARTGSGIIGAGIKPRLVYAPSEADFHLQLDVESYGYTICGWTKTADASTPHGIVEKDAHPSVIAADCEYRLEYNGVGNFYFRHYGNLTYDDVDTDTVLDLISPNTWYFVIGWVDPTKTKIYIRANNSTPAEKVLTQADYVQSSTPFSIGSILDPGAPANFDTDNVAIWRRVLTEDEMLWLWNGGAGRSFAEINPEDTSGDCEAVTCCDEERVVGTYQSDQATDSGVGSNVDDPCASTAQITFEPPCGSTVLFPIIVSITSNYPDATIFYTTDGTTPTEASTVYTGPFEVTGPEITVKAFASPVLCPDSSMFQCSWLNYPEVSALFGVQCTPTFDYVGQWGDWTPNGTLDYHFWLAIINAANIDVARFELYQLDDSLNWTTGAAWATANPIVPELPWNQENTFQVYPLIIDEVGVGFVQSDYTDNWGTIAAGTNQYILYGEPIIPLGGIFKIIMIETNGRRTYAYAAYADCLNPPSGPCPNPELTALAPGCQKLTVTFDILAPNRNYRVYYKKSVDAAYTLGPTGNGSGTGLTKDISSLAHDTSYDVYVAQELHESPTYDHCSDWTNSNVASAKTNKATTISLVASAASVVSGGTVDITVTSANVPAGGTIEITNDNTLAGAPCGAHPWAPAINGSSSCTFTLTADTTWTATVTGGCGTAMAEVTVVVVASVAECPVDWICSTSVNRLHMVVYPTDPGAPGPADYWTICSDPNPSSNCQPSTGQVPFNGDVRHTENCICRWHTGPTWAGRYAVSLNSVTPMRAAVVVTFEDAGDWGGVPGVGWWMLTVSCLRRDNSQPNPIWIGYKDSGNRPEGIYLRLTTQSMCDTSRAAINAYFIP